MIWLANIFLFYCIIPFINEHPKKVTDYAWSSNCMGTTKKTSIMEHWWENIKDKLTRICNPGEYETEKVCCYEKGKRKKV